MLNSIIKKDSHVVIGLNSGTSADGLDLAAVKIKYRQSNPVPEFIAGKTVVYPDNLVESLNEAIGGHLSIDETIILDRKLGNFYGEQTALFNAFLRRKNIKPDLVASHGQTIRHLPGKVKIGRKKESATFQMGHPESIAGRTGLPVIADFRQADIASGGEGAPITSYPMWLFFADKKETRLVINIGGIANYFLFEKGKGPDSISARDCGPGNTLLDIVANRFFGKRYDRDGRFASRGQISKRLLTILLADNYLKGKYGPSTGRERFGEKFVENIIKNGESLGLGGFDVMATATELTAVTISNSIKRIISRKKLEKIYLFGGGLYNGFLVDRLKENINGTQIQSVERLNVEPDFLEAACFAVMGGMAVKGIPTGVPKVTGGRGKTIGGRIIMPPLRRNNKEKGFV